MWSQVECGYDSANETIVFGSRQIAEGDALYETSTVAVISSEEQPKNNPIVQCINRNGKILLAIDNTFRILSQGCTSLDLYASFECSINSFNISSDDQILILCLSDGNVHCLHVPSNGKLICSVLITEATNRLSIIATSNDESSSFIICTSKNIYCLKINKVNDIFEQIANEIEDLNIDFTFENLDVKINPSLTRFQHENNVYYTSNKKRFADCNKIAIALDDEGTIVAICKLTKLMFKLYNKDFFKDLMVLRSINSDDHRFLVSTVSETGTYIRLLSYPNFETVYNLKVSEHTYLVSINNEQDEVMFIEGVCSKGSEYVNELRLKVITESNPDVKLKRLLRRKSFKEAKEFAKIYKLDMQQIYTTEAEEYIINNNFQITNVEEFCSILNNIKDIIFIVTQCLINTTADTLENIERLLKYSYDRLQSVLQNNPDNEICNKYKDTILNLFFKMDTFKVLHNSEDFDNTEMLIDAWIHFSSVDLLEKMHNYLKNGKLDKCTLLFNRLQLENILDAEKIQSILTKIPTNDLLNYLPLINHIILFSLQSQPETLTIIMDWIQDTILRYDVLKSEWLEYLLTFCEHINKFLYANEVQNLNFQKNFNPNGSLQRFRNLLTVLNELSMIKKDYGIKILISDYMQEPFEVIQLLLDQVSLKQLKEFMNKFVMNFCIQHRMNVDEILSYYIKFISGTQKPYWDEAVICLIPFISSNTLRMETILIVLESADVPWSNIVEQFAEQGANECHPLASRVKNLKENIPWKMLLKKYSIVEQPNYDNEEVILIVRKILMISKTDMLHDLEVIITKHPCLKNRIQVLCLNHFIQQGKTEHVFKYLNNVKDEIIVDCFNSAMVFIQNFIFSKLSSNNIVRNYMDIISSLLNRIEKHILEHEYEIYRKQVKKIKNICFLKEKYNCTEITSLDYDLSTLLPKIIKSIITPKNDESINWLETVYTCEQISNILDISKENAFFELEKQVTNLKSLIYCAENIIKSDCSPYNMCTMAVLLMKNIDNNQIVENGLNHNSFFSQNNEYNTDDVIMALKLINKLALKACVNANTQELETACEILNWSKGCFWIKNMDENLSNIQFTAIFHPENICTFSISSTLVIKSYFDLLLKIAEDRIILPKYMREKKTESSLLQEHLLSKIDALPDKMKQLHIEGYDLTAYHLLNFIKIELISLNINPEILAKAILKINYILNNRYVPQLLDKIFVSKKIDQHLAFSLFLSTDFQPLKWILCALKKYKTNVKKLNAASSLICNYLELKHMHPAAYLNLKYRCEWWQKFLNHCVSYNDTFQLEPNEIVTSYLLKSDKFNLKILKDFCEDFDLNIQKYLPLYLRNTLVQWKPEIEDGNIFGEQELFNKCKDIISRMENKIVIVQTLNTAWSEISYYQHEVYLCILDLFVNLEENCTNPDKGVLLMFLKDYRRINKPQQKEIEDWQTKYPFAKEMDPLSEYRLPYFLEMCSKDFWKIIRPEINLMTYEKWFINAPYLDLDQNHICIFAIKGTVDSGILNSKEPNWSTNSKHDSLLRNMEMCVRQITDLKSATAVLYQAVKKVTGGADQVFIAKMCWEKALQWKKSTPRSSGSESDINMKCIEFRRMYLNYLTMHILYTYKVGTKKYLNLIENTEQLIKELYHDDSIIERTKGTVMFYPDINSVVDKLASQLGVDIILLRTDLIMDFLQKSCKIINLDESTYINFNSNTTDEDNDNICDNLKRVVYICQSQNSEECNELLYNISFAKLDDTISKFGSSPDLSMRIKALQCLIIITDDIKVLEEMIGESPSSYLEKLQILLCLESLGYSLTVFELDNCNKIDLATKILRTKSSNAAVVKNIAKLCANYKIWETSLWNTILQCFIDLRMFSDLQEWLPKLYKICYSPDLECPFVCGWSSLIKNSFLKSLNDSKSYSQGLLLIQICPIVTMLENCFEEIFNLYFQNDIPEICAMCLPYVQNNKTKNNMLELLANKKNTALYEKIENLSLQGILNTDIVMKCLNELF